VIKHYLSGLMTEGVKQNFMGSDINAEFLILSVDVYAKRLAKRISHYRSRLRQGIADVRHIQNKHAINF